MITCPWCGTSYLAFQSSCQKCGGPLNPPAKIPLSEAGKAILKPPPAPRMIADSYRWQLILTDGWAIVAGVFVILGTVFTGLGLILTIAIATAFVGIPFMGFGIPFLGLGLAGFMWRYQKAQKILTVLRSGESTDGQIVSVRENYAVRVALRHPQVIHYQFQFNGNVYQGEASTLNQTNFQSGQAVCVLYLPQSPEYNALYPHP